MNPGLGLVTLLLALTPFFCLAEQQPQSCMTSILCKIITATISAPAVVMTALPGSSTEASLDRTPASTQRASPTATKAPVTTTLATSPKDRTATPQAEASTSTNPYSASSLVEHTPGAEPPSFEGSSPILRSHWDGMALTVAAVGFLLS